MAVKYNKEINKKIKRYTISCANFLRNNNVDISYKPGFLALIIMALSNKGSVIYQLTKKNYEDNPTKDLLDDLADEYIMEALDGYHQNGNTVSGIWDIDKVPQNQRKILKAYYNDFFVDILSEAPKSRDKYFERGNTILTACLYSLYENIILLQDKVQGIDVTGIFFNTFLHYSKAAAKEKGIVLTPKHITNLFCDIAEFFYGKFTNETVILDSCCGTGGFLLSAADRVRENGYDENQLIGIDSNINMYALTYSNIKLHGFKNIRLYNCSSLLKDKTTITHKGKDIVYDELNYAVPLSTALSKIGKIDIGMINPPYALGKVDNEDKKFSGQSELDFIASMLDMLTYKGIGIAIVPISSAGNKFKSIRTEIMKKHTLLACMSMPNELFTDNNICVKSCIMVFQAHVPHTLNDSVLFCNWTDDGFEKVPYSGRIDKGKWEDIHALWLNSMSDIVSGISVRKKMVNISDECSVENYIDTDYHSITNDVFISELQKYALFKYKLDNEFDFNNQENTSEDELLWFMRHSTAFNKDYTLSVDPAYIDIHDSVESWKPFYLEKLFEVKGAKITNSDDLSEIGEELYPYISSKNKNNGIEGMYSEWTDEGNVITVDSATKGYIYYQKTRFAASSHVEKLIPKFKMNQYIAMFFVGLLSMERYRYSHGRKFNQKRIKKTILYLPVTDNDKPDFGFMERFIKTLPYTIKL